MAFDIDVLKAKFRKKGFTEAKADMFAREITNVARSYGVNPYQLVDEIKPNFDLNDLGAFVINSSLRFGYQTGTIKPSKPNAMVQRAIIT